MESEIATHDAPVWAARANFLVFADLSSVGMQGRWEQLWARQLGDAEFELCCIPFFTYGLALGDTVQTQATCGRRYVVAEVRAKSGRRVVRFWLEAADAAGRGGVLRYLEAQSPMHEWSSVNLLVVDVPPSGPDGQLEALLQSASRSGIDFEWGD
jgi:hypothetical protein